MHILTKFKIDEIGINLRQIMGMCCYALKEDDKILQHRGVSQACLHKILQKCKNKLLCEQCKEFHFCILQQKTFWYKIIFLYCHSKGKKGERSLMK